MKQQYKHRQKQGGFTLIELIVVIAIIGILAALVVPSVTGYVQQAQAATCQRNIQSAAQMLDQVVAQDMGSYSEEGKLNNLLKDIMENNGDYFSKPVKCPGGGIYTYNAYWAANGTLQCTITCSKHSGIEGSKTVGKKMDDSMGEWINEIEKIKNDSSLSTAEKNKLLEAFVSAANGHVSNDSIRAKFFEEYGDKWPELETEILEKSVNLKGKTLYVQPYAVMTGQDVEKVLIYAGDKALNSSSGKWNASAIYNPDDNTWYERVDGKAYGMYALGPGRNPEALNTLMEELQDPNIWTPIK